MLAANKPWLDQYTFLIRLGTAVRSYAVYLGKAFWPVKLAFDYPHPGYSLRWVEVAAALVLLLAITAVAVMQRRHGYLLVGWLWFCVTMLPTSNLVQIDRAPFADRYAYICFVGLFLMVIWGVADIAQQRSLPRALLPTVSVVVLVALGLTTRRQVAFWSDNIMVWQHTVGLYHTWSAEHELSALLIQRGDLEQALALDYSALEQRPRDPVLLFDIARIEYQRHNLGQAILLYQRALPLSGTPETRAKIFAAMGHIYGELGDTAKAAECYRQSNRLRADSSNAEP